MGLCSSAARVGGAISPLIFGLDGTVWTGFSNTVFGTLGFIAAVLSLFMPETRGKCMSQVFLALEIDFNLIC